MAQVHGCLCMGAPAWVHMAMDSVYCKTDEITLAEYQVLIKCLFFPMVRKLWLGEIKWLIHGFRM